MAVPEGLALPSAPRPSPSVNVTPAAANALRILSTLPAELRIGPNSGFSIRLLRDLLKETRIRAEAKFKKKDQQRREGDKVWAEREAADRLSEAKTIRLRALRLATQAAEKW